jgi:hypothetical protein
MLTVELLSSIHIHMPFGSYETPKPTPIPTFFQYIKTCGKGVEGKTRFAVDIIWLPGKFDNITLQTHAFRYICDPDHPLYNEVKQYVGNLAPESETPQIQIVISSLEKRTIEVLEHPKTKGIWSKVGSNAVKFKNP